MLQVSGAATHPKIKLRDQTNQHSNLPDFLIKVNLIKSSSTLKDFVFLFSFRRLKIYRIWVKMYAITQSSEYVATH